MIEYFLRLSSQVNSSLFNKVNNPSYLLNYEIHENQDESNSLIEKA
jgi:hypothetical protein